MLRRDREVIEIGERAPLALVIDRLMTFQSGLTLDSHAEVKIGGDDLFGWRFTITYLREPTPEEIALEAKYKSLREGARGDWQLSPFACTQGESNAQ